MEELDSIVEFTTSIKDQQQPDPLPSGKYVGTIRDVEVKMSQRETRYAAISFFVGADQFPADWKDGNPDGMTLIYRRVGLEDTANSRFGLRRFCESIGAPMSKKIDTAEWVGMEGLLEVGHDTYEGVTRANIERVSEA
jgi:hypothetical protein